MVRISVTGDRRGDGKTTAAVQAFRAISGSVLLVRTNFLRGWICHLYDLTLEERNRVVVDGNRDALRGLCGPVIEDLD